ncbi:hypothetical protein [Rhodococcus sp. UFZ-B548]|uniref:hypothetical protein n=1 Tax=Rhodococcus sp. UFZ-B548 TaxID=2742212 RepID=UPI0015F4E115|nr:hypothetical protein [Rhodococcus sp. UFZ-B548]
MNSDRPIRSAKAELLDLVGELHTPEEAGAILFPHTADVLSKIDQLREESVILSLEADGQHRYPAFQLDIAERRVRNAVEYANRVQHAAARPWSTAAWWLTASPLFADDRGRALTPMELAATGVLTQIAVDNILVHGSARM